MADKKILKQEKEAKKGYLVLVRHGESVWNQKGLWTGWEDVELSEKGREEAKQTAKALSDIPVDAAFSSDLKRARETLSIIISELQIPGIPTEIFEAFKERNYGILTGKSKWEIKKEVGEEKFKKIRRGWNEPIEGGESLKDVSERVLPAFIGKVLPMVINGKNTLLVAHGNTHRAIIKHLEKISDTGIEDVEIATGEAFVYRLNPEGQVILKEKRAVNKSRGKQ